MATRLTSQLADGAFQVALASYVVFSPERQATPAKIASALAVLLLPYSLLGPFTGVLLDRWRRRQVLLRANLLRAGLAAATAALLLTSRADWSFYAAALLVTAVNRFVLAGLSASLPHTVPAEKLITANAVAPTAGTVAATLGGGAALVVQLVVPPGSGADAAVVAIAGALYLVSAGCAATMPVALLGPARVRRIPLRAAVADTARGLRDGLRHLAARRAAADALAAVTAMRFCYGVLTVTMLMLCRYAFNDPSDTAAGLRTLGLAVGLSGAGFFVAALITPSAVRRLGVDGWIVACAAAAAVLEPLLGLTFRQAPVLAAAFFVGIATQGVKIATDTAVQSGVDDAYRGRVFALYDMLFNGAYVAAAALAALVLPADGRAPHVLAALAVLYALVAAGHALGRRRRARLNVTRVPQSSKGS
ncbi:MFS transporter [Mangrovactinospora gilvigrisea]|uniref:MFS transporter n=1 Tax=Mangrovactinospora gilvigrisea TaxID=1428644 RepID=A0A1J7CC61_9ACTN|nr:MFS transporter [Mangrovactinospora gilvigrisea]